MKKRVEDILVALVLAAAGVLLILRAFNVLVLDMSGWWTLFIIVPALISMIRQGIRLFNILILAAGVLLLLRARGVKVDVNVWLVFAGAALLAIGAKVLINRPVRPKKGDTSNFASYYGIFGGGEYPNSSPDFKGANTWAIFGGVELDLREATIQKEAFVNSYTIFGGGEIYVPPDVNVVVKGVPVFGGFSNEVKKPFDESLPTLNIYCVTVFGAMEIKDKKK